MKVIEAIARGLGRRRAEIRAAAYPVSREAFEAEAAAVPRVPGDAWAALAAAAAEATHRRLAEAMQAHGPVRDSMVSEARGMADLWSVFCGLREARPRQAKGGRR